MAPSTRKSLLAIALAVLTAFAPALLGPFVLDDEQLILRNPHFSSGRNALELLSRPVVATLPGGATNVYYRPLSFLSQRLDLLIWGDRPAGFHLVNILLHLASAAALYFLVRRWEGGEGKFSLAIAILWGVFPLHAEAASYIACRNDVLAHALYLLALLAYTSERGRWRHPVYAACAAAAFLAKEMAITIPIAAMLADGFLRRPAERRSRRLLLAAAAGNLLLLGALFGIRWMAVHAMVPETAAVPPAPGEGAEAGQGRPAGIDALLILSVGWHYLKILAAPLSYSIDRSRDTAATWQGAACFALSAAAAAALWGGAVRRLDAGPRRLALFAACWAMAAYLPVSNLVPLYSRCADRYLSFPMAPLFLAAGTALGALPPAFRLRLRSAWILPAAVFWALALHRSTFFTSERRLYEISLRESPGSPLLHNNLGLLEKRGGDATRAASQFQTALDLAPDYPEARFNLGVLRREGGDPAAAEALLAACVRSQPGDADGWLQWGLAALAGGRTADAIDRLDRADGLRGRDLGIRYHLALARYRAGDRCSARAILEDLRGRFPSHANTARLLEDLDRESLRRKPDPQAGPHPDAPAAPQSPPPHLPPPQLPPPQQHR